LAADETYGVDVATTIRDKPRHRSTIAVCIANSPIQRFNDCRLPYYTVSNEFEFLTTFLTRNGLQTIVFKNYANNGGMVRLIQETYQLITYTQL